LRLVTGWPSVLLIVALALGLIALNLLSAAVLGCWSC
jgi:hypothetical protein